jgi:hypothetical protein
MRTTSFLLNASFARKANFLVRLPVIHAQTVVMESTRQAQSLRILPATRVVEVSMQLAVLCHVKIVTWDNFNSLLKPQTTSADCAQLDVNLSTSQFLVPTVQKDGTRMRMTIIVIILLPCASIVLREQHLKTSRFHVPTVQKVDIRTKTKHRILMLSIQTNAPIKRKKLLHAKRVPLAKLSQTFLRSARHALSVGWHLLAARCALSAFLGNLSTSLRANVRIARVDCIVPQTTKVIDVWTVERVHSKQNLVAPTASSARLVCLLAAIRRSNHANRVQTITFNRELLLLVAKNLAPTVWCWQVELSKSKFQRVRTKFVRKKCANLFWHAPLAGTV